MWFPLSQGLIQVPLPKSVFRAALARLAALCNERNPGSVSSYGGEGELVIGAEPSHVCHVTFTNTSSTQWVRLTRTRQDNPPDQRDRPQESARESGPRLRASAAR